MKRDKMTPDCKPMQYWRSIVVNWMCAMMAIFVALLPESTMASSPVRSLVILRVIYTLLAVSISVQRNEG
jgi:hypothetical protein